MTASDSIFLDTAPIIYLIENNQHYYSKVSRFLTDNILKEVYFSTSVLSIAEFGVKPKKSGKLDLINEMEQMLSALQIKIADITMEVANLASTLRANNQFLKGIDSLQLAAAIQLNCNLFLTNDKALKQISEIKVLTMDDII
jgi:predicted nucleic acid-binding protein